MRGDSTQTGMEADEGSAGDRNSRRSPGHHVMIAGSVVVLVVADRADDRKLVQAGSQLGHVLGELHARYGGVDGLKVAADFGRSLRLGVEGLEVSWSAIHP